MSKRKRIIALLVGVILLAGTAGTLAWLSVTGVLVNQFGIGSVTPSVQETLNGRTRVPRPPIFVLQWISTGRTRMAHACGMSRRRSRGVRRITRLRGAWLMPRARTRLITGLRRATGSITGRRPSLLARKPACSLIGLPSSRQPKVAILSWISPLRRSRRRPMRPCTTHGVARSRMTCWCRRMEVRKYGVPDS